MNKKTKKAITIEEKSTFKEVIYSGGSYVGYIYCDEEGDYLFKAPIFFNSKSLGRGKVLKEVAERLIELNYGKGD